MSVIETYFVYKIMNEHAFKVDVLFKEFKTELEFTNPYIYWHTSKKLKCFHVDFFLALEHKSEKLILLTINSKNFKAFKFLLKSDPRDLITALKDMLYPTPRSFLIIHNQKSGPGISSEVLQKHFLPILNLTPYKYEIKETSQNLFEKVNEDFTDLIFFSGDGTVQRLLTDLYRKSPDKLSKISIGVVPTGSRNSLAVELSGKSIPKAIFNIIKAKHIVGDLMKVQLDSEVVLATTAILLGLGADIPKEADDLRGIGPIRFPYVILRKLVKKWKSITAAINYSTPSGNIVSKTSNFNGIFLGNHKAQNILNDEIPYPLGKIDSGDLEGILVENCSKLQALRIFWQTMNSGQHLFNPNAQFFKFISLVVKTENPINVSVDGEIYSSSNIQVTVWPGAVKFLGDLKNNR